MASVSSDDTVGSDGSTACVSPQEMINEFWDGLITKKPAKVTKIFPQSLYTHLLPPQRNLGTSTGKNANESYEAAAAECRARVERIVKECVRTNEKFTDQDFDIENLGNKNCLEGLMYWYEDKVTTSPSVSPSQVGSALSTLIKSGVLMTNGLGFEFNATAKLLNGQSSNSGDGPRSNPKFAVDGFSSSDLKQGSSCDCWFIAAVSTICSNPALMDKICVAQDEECGVYGFVFYRDGEWIWTVVDDNLYLSSSDFGAARGDRWDPTNTEEIKYKKNEQTGSRALYFASCEDENETWLPLLEKAYAKGKWFFLLHGDYDAIAGGYSGEAVEDLTGGVTTKILTNRVLRKESLWNELLQVGKKFLFSASSLTAYGDDTSALKGLALEHAYSVLKVVEEEGEDGKKYRLVLIRNPWGGRADAATGEWTGPWSDGSREWTPYWLKKLDHKFGDDGLFWMTYEEMLERFDLLDRTRLFDDTWTVVQHWTSVSVAWVTGYMDTKFSVEIKKSGPTVFVLCQLDERYFKGIQGKYHFDLHFILQGKDAGPGDHIVRARGAWFDDRTISAEANLEPGIYEVVPKIEASRDAQKPEVYEVVKKLATSNPQKLRQIGLNYDIAHAKGTFETDKEAAEVKEKEAKAAKKEKEDFETFKKKTTEGLEVWKKEIEEKLSKQGSVDTKESKDSETTTEQPVTKTDAAEGPEDKKDTSAASDKSEDSFATATVTAKSSGSTTEPETEVQVVDSSKDKEGTKGDDTAAADNEAILPHSRETQTQTTSDEPTPTQPPSAPKPAPTKEEVKPWNAVCILGLRVYSLDPEVTIKLVKPKDAEEAAILDVDGDTAAGATM
ncbi:calpain family cysteine protease [Pyrenophora tritici-repentis]|nr:calpain family cysteine protease [Pyrenophora tritici-repentis]